MNTQMHQEAFPGEDISDRPPPEDSVPGLLAIVYGDAPSGRYQATQWPRHEPRWRSRSRRSSRPASATTSGCWSPRGAGISHHRFLDLPDLLEPGDLLVVNTSATLPAALAGSARACISRHHSPARLARGRVERWVIELREGDARHRGGRAGQRIALPGGGEAELLAPYLGGRRLWAARLRLPAPLLEYLAATASRSATATSPSRARSPTTRRSSRASPAAPRCRAPGGRSASACLEQLEERGIAVATIVLHTGVSSLERGERPYPERFRVPAATLAAVRAAQRVIAVGTTVVRALETPPPASPRAGRGSWSSPSPACAWSTASSPAGTSPTPATC